MVADTFSCLEYLRTIHHGSNYTNKQKVEIKYVAEGQYCVSMGKITLVFPNSTLSWTMSPGVLIR